jgi:choline dehydrogenase-like flavoprotein
MIIDARTLPADETIETEVCIVGTGPAGVSLARELAGQHFRVCLLESGGLDRPNAETKSLGNVETDGTFVQVTSDNRNRQFGGNSSYWGIKLKQTELGVRLTPLDEVDFEKRDWLPYSGWPFTREHLVPYYERAQAVFQAGPFAYAPEDWETEDAPKLPFKQNRAATSIFQFGNGSLFSTLYRDEIDRANNITTYIHANAIELETDEDGNTIRRVKVACLEGKSFWISAKLVILAAGGVENTHLLLLSNKTHKAGIGNQYDQVGRFFMDHPIIQGGVIVPFDRQIFNRTALYDLRRINGAHVMGGLTLTDDAMRREQLPNITAWIFPRDKRFCPSQAMTSLKTLLSPRCLEKGPQGLLQNLGNVVTGIDDIAGSVYDKLTRKPQPFWSNLSTGGWSHLQDNKERAYGVFEVVHMIEQAPHPDNRLLLGDELDRLGRRRIRLQSCWREADLHGVSRAQAAIAEDLYRSGIGQLQIARNGEEFIVDTLGASHHMGTTRMHVDPAQGVVDENCKVHEVSNLFIASSSVFPTGGCANPTLTIVALAIRLADRVKTLMAGAL